MKKSVPEEVAGLLGMFLVLAMFHFSPVKATGQRPVPSVVSREWLWLVNALSDC